MYLVAKFWLYRPWFHKIDAIISENINELKGFNTKLDWERVYLYNDTFKTILGKVSSEKQGIPAELKDYYLESGNEADIKETGWN